MKIAVNVRVLLLAASVALALAAAPGSASAANLTCKGHTQLGTVTEDADHPLDYVFACTGRIVGYTIISDRELDYFDPELEVTDPAGATVPSDGFACEGDIPGTGVNCLGTYGTNNLVRGQLSVDEQETCAEPRPHLQVVAVGETIDVTGKALKTSKGESAGPFDLGRPRGCKKSSELAGVLALIEELREDLRAPSEGNPLGA